MHLKRTALRSWAAGVAGVVGIAAVGVLDYLTGPDLGFSLFYLLPILVTALFGRRGMGLSAAIVSAVVWWYVDELGGRTYDLPLVHEWNALIRLFIFLIIVLLVGALRQANDTLERRVEEKTEHVRKLASKVASTEARERERVARLLHDDLQQQLHAIQFQVADIRQQMQGKSAQDIQEAVQRMLASLKEASRTTRTLATELSPPALRSDDFTVAINWLAEHFQGRHGLTVRVDAPAVIAIPTDTDRDLLLSLVRECLFNVVKHAGVDEAYITIRQVDTHVEIAIEDYGIGFDCSALTRLTGSGTGFGLGSAAQRLELVGGTLQINSGGKKRGTHIAISLPTPEPSNAPPR